MIVKIDILLGGYRHHTRDQVFLLEDMRKDLVFYSGDDNKLKLKMRYRDRLYCTYDYDITGWVFDLIVKVNPTDADEDALINEHITDLTDPIEGETDIVLPVATGVDYTGNNIYQLLGTNTEGKKRLLCEGLFQFKQSLFNE